jgi:hypothetical protein
LREEDLKPGGDPLHNEPGMGIRFLYRDESERRRLQQIVEKLMVDSLGRLVYEKLMQYSSTTPGGGDEPDSTGS